MLIKNMDMLSTSIMTSVDIINVNLLNFASTMVVVINAMYSALAKAQAAANSAAASAASAARSASAAASSASSSSSSSSTKGTKAIGGAITENGVYYLHKGETVVNPVSSSFSNSSSGIILHQVLNLIIVHLVGLLIGRKKWIIFYTQMRHIR
jgi:hypothetical protein